jgi:hypothetical protein
MKQNFVVFQQIQENAAERNGERRKALISSVYIRMGYTPIIHYDITSG